MATPKKPADTEAEAGAETGTETTSETGTKATIVVPVGKSYKCLSHLSHNNVDYLPGSMVELPDNLVQHLAASGVIELPGV